MKRIREHLVTVLHTIPISGATFLLAKTMDESLDFNGVTELAHDFTLDTRIDMERWAGELFGLRVA